MKSSQLTITTESFEKFDFDVIDNCVTAGRGESNVIVLRDSKVSREHCKFKLLDGAVTLYDCESKNGVFVNGIRQDEVRLLNGDRIKIGNSTLGVAIINGEISKEFNDKTLVFDTLGHAVFPDEHTQESISFVGNPGEGNTLLPAIISFDYPQKSISIGKKVFDTIKSSKIYLFVSCLFLLGIAAFVFSQFNDSSDMQASIPNSSLSTNEELIEKGNEQQLSDIKMDNIQFTGESSNQPQANQLAREALMLSNLGKYDQAIVVCNQAIALDPENKLAATNLRLLNVQVETIARNCFDNGLRAYKFFDYTSAVHQWNNVLHLLDSRRESELYLKTVRLLEQAKLKSR